MLASAKRIVIKVGSSLIAGDDHHLRASWLASLAEDIHALKSTGKQVIVVTSGAVALGRHVLGYGTKSLTLEEKQAAAAAGQIELFAAWRDALGSVAQILLTADDSIDRRRYLNACNTLETLLENPKVVPIINENDTVATEELRFGDNDRLSARVAQMAGADLLILLSDVDGLYDKDPNHHKDAKFIPEVKAITAEIERMGGDSASHIGSGGMATKLEAAKIAMAAGCHMIIAQGHKDHPLKNLEKCTHFLAQGTPKSARKHWIAGSVHSAGSVTVDDGAAKALTSGKSLLPAGVVGVSGEFDRGDAVLIKNMNGAVLGKGLIAYGSADAAKILGKKSSEIEKILGFKGRDVLIHRDDMALE